MFALSLSVHVCLSLRVYEPRAFYIDWGVSCCPCLLIWWWLAPTTRQLAAALCPEIARKARRCSARAPRLVSSLPPQSGSALPFSPTTHQTKTRRGLPTLYVLCCCCCCFALLCCPQKTGKKPKEERGTEKRKRERVRKEPLAPRVSVIVFFVRDKITHTHTQTSCRGV